MFSVLLEEINGKKYYRKSRKKYMLDETGAQVVETIPEDIYSRTQFYYYESGEWIFDEEAYNAYLLKLEEAAKAREEAEKAEAEEAANQVTQDDILAGMMEIAENQSNMKSSITDIEAALIELAGMVSELREGV